MSDERRQRNPVAVVVERRAIDHAWSDHRWSVIEVLPGAPVAAPWTVLGAGEGWTRWLAGVADLEVFAAETETYKYNLESPAPAVYVMLRRCDEAPGLRLLGATVCPGEAHAHHDTGDDLVEAVAMPPEIRAWLTDFVARHHVERTVWKRRRDRADPEALAAGARRGTAIPVDGDDDE